MNMLRQTVSLLFAAWLFAASVAAQVASTGAIAGTITDATGASVPQADIKITNTATQVTRTLRTNETGFYAAESLLAGAYDVEVAKTGFRGAVVRGVILAPGQRIDQDVSLEVTGVETAVTVEAEPVQVRTETSETGGVVSSSQVENLLVNGRSFLGLGLLVPGVNSASSTGRSVGGGSLVAGGLTGETPLSINGLGREFSLYTIDGAYNMNTGNNINLNVSPPLPAINEFRIATANYSAKYGVAGSAQVMVETKSGTRAFHGELYNFLRNDALDASNFFSGGQKTPLKQNIFGFALGGPVIIPGLYNTKRDKQTFFFVNEEWRVIRTGLTLRGAMFPEAMRRGDFSNSPTLRTLPGSSTKGLQLSDSAQRLLAGRGNCLISPTAINPSCFDPNAVVIMNTYWPLPNNPSGGFLNYINPGVDKIDQRNDMYRVDQYLSERFVLMGRWMYEEVKDAPPALIWGPNPAPTTQQSIYTTGLNALLRFTMNLKPTIVNTVSITGTATKPRLRPVNFERPADLRIQDAFPEADPLNRIPTVTVAGGWAGIGTGVMPIDASDGEGVLSDDISIVKGSHVLQAGGLYIWGIKRQNLFVPNQGQFSFSGVHTNDPAADFMLGLVGNYFQQSGNRRGYFHYRQFEPYFQDDWKVTRNLTLNLGLRYVYISSDTVEGDGISSFDVNRWQAERAPAVNLNGTLRTNAAGQVITPSGQEADLLNGVIFAGRDGVPRGFFIAQKLNFAPRAGFAWDPFGNGRTSIRGGYGMGYGRIPFDNYAAFSNPPYLNSVTLLNGTLSNPSAGVAGAVTATGMSLVAPDFKPTRIQSWSFTVQRELMRGGVATIGYVGSGSRFLKGSQDINFPLPVGQPTQPGCLQPGQAGPAGGFDFDPCINTGRTSANVTRPLSGWSNLSLPWTGGTSNYHSLQTSFQDRTGPLQLNGNYTWGKALTDVANRGFDGRNTGSGAQNSRNFELEYGPPGWDRRHIFTAGYVYDLPFRGSQGIVRKLLGNWTFSGITVIQSGFILSPGLATGTNGLASRPNVAGDPEGPKRLDRWFNTDAFVAPSYGFFGNAGTGLIRGPDEDTWNWALFKSFPMNERSQVQFRAEAFNIWNHPNFDAVSTSVGAGNYGQVTRAMEPRILEFALKFIF